MEIVASMATLPHRRISALRAIASILPQVDTLCLWLDKHTAQAAVDTALAVQRLAEDVGAGYERKPSIITRAGDVGDGGKFFPLSALDDDALWLTLDDDFEYPAGYAATMRVALRRAEGALRIPCVVGLHGMRLPEHCMRYRKERKQVQHCLHFPTRIERPQRVHVLGTASVATRPGYLRGFEKVDITTPRNVGDLHLAAWCEENGVDRWCQPLPLDGWITNLLPPGAPSIWRDAHCDNENAVIRRTLWASLPPPVLPPNTQSKP